jgi:RNA-binding proteins (RRM domain)
MNLYVSNLGFHINDDDLTTLFTTYGNVTSAKVITDKFTGKSRGFGFVEMQDDAAQNAMRELDGKQIEGRSISVTEARPKTNRGGGGFSGNRGGSRW